MILCDGSKIAFLYNTSPFKYLFTQFSIVQGCCLSLHYCSGISQIVEDKECLSHLYVEGKKSNLKKQRVE